MNRSAPTIAVAIAALCWGYMMGHNSQTEEIASKLDKISKQIRQLEFEMKVERIEHSLEKSQLQLESMNHLLEGSFEGIHAHIERRPASCTVDDIDIEELELACEEYDEYGYIPDC